MSYIEGIGMPYAESELPEGVLLGAQIVVHDENMARVEVFLRPDTAPDKQLELLHHLHDSLVDVMDGIKATIAESN